MTLKITSFKAVKNETEMETGNIPFLWVNITFKIDKKDEDDTHLWERTKAESEEYIKTFTIDDPVKYIEWVMNTDFEVEQSYPGFGRAWTLNDNKWNYIEKFDTFHFRDCIAYSSVTLEILDEILYYKENGKLKNIYRHTDESVVLTHIRTLSSYWD
jgi:hypothetical protein